MSDRAPGAKQKVDPDILGFGGRFGGGRPYVRGVAPSDVAVDEEYLRI